MDSLLAPGAKLEKLFTGTTWAEGPVWLPESHSVRWSDIPNNRIMEYDSESGEARVHRSAAEYTNGRTLDIDGRVVQCSHGRRSIEREVDGAVETLVDRWQGHRLNSPNDIVVASDGTIWFTDPPYGILSDVEGHPGEQEYGGCWVFCFDPATDALTPVITDMVYPNGLAFSPDESILYVSDTSSGNVPNGPCHIRAYDVDVASMTASNGRVFAEVGPGCADGFRVDVDGRIWTSSEDSVQVLSPQGAVLLKIPVPEKVANLCFGGEDGHDLYVTATTGLYRIRTATTQAERPVKR